VLNPGDEVILIEPFYDIYPANVHFAQANPVFVPLREPKAGAKTAQDLQLDILELRKKITPKTKGIIFNNPHNPTGKVYTRHEMEQIAQVVQEFDLIVFSDEVYEFLVFGNNEKTQKPLQHERIATLPGMWERTFTICSAGKTFSNTGWKIGWSIAPSNLTFNAYLVNQYKVFSVATPLQRAVADCLEQMQTNGYLSAIQNRLKQRYEYLANIYEKDVGLPIIKPMAGYFMLGNIEKIAFENDSKRTIANDDKGRDYEFARWLPASDVGVAAIPPSAFMTRENRHLMEKYARFCFSKEQETLDKAKTRLVKLKDYIKQ